MTLGYGGNPYGPAGTGKTESVKALGQALARQVLQMLCNPLDVIQNKPDEEAACHSDLTHEHHL